MIRCNKMVDLKVIKRDGREVQFNPDKIIQSCGKVGLSEEIANKITKEITKELSNITTADIRDLIIDKLKNRDRETLESWKKYEKNMK
ncbi:MAG: hypothetical protein GF329_00255 [Candidatus Lokiarchaeota archaeon]|nr:hypothetical protein [Candidatus Lokiarchaeota archaeon]